MTLPTETIEPRPYYQDDAVTVYHGDCREIMPRLTADVLVTDPPYGFGSYPTDHDPGGEVIAALVAAATTSALFGYPETLVKWCVEGALIPDEWVTWWPTNKAVGRGAKLPKESEHIAVFGPMPGVTRIMRPRSQDGYARKLATQRGLDPEWARMGDVWRDSAPGTSANRHLRTHPNEKPVEVMRRLVDLCSEPQQTILDPFCGSGTTLRAAKDLGRLAIGIELEERYCDIAAKRCAQEVFDLRERGVSVCRGNCGWAHLPDDNAESCPACGHDPDLEEFRQQIDALSRAALASAPEVTD